LPYERGKVDATRLRREAPCPISPSGRLLDRVQRTRWTLAEVNNLEEVSCD
jgi:hypothetical protein